MGIVRARDDSCNNAGALARVSQTTVCDTCGSATSAFISATTHLRNLAVTNNRSVQALLAEATDLLFQVRGLAARDE